ncbi:MAG: hypothetical protein KZQ65_06045 [Candidatus Thiodiazotropha sp. (ex Gloverina cf. vestifex)]|nr:hypothetical protein [Candidatus Thiodiazotropha sp. (ex Gloverina cf. vestifex)]
MDTQDFKKLIRFPKIFALMVVACIVLALPFSVSADNRVEFDDFEESISGPLDGLDLKKKWIWVDDMIYYLDRNVKVKGTSTKLGLIMDLKQGEVVKLRLRPNDKEPSIPYVVLIERE